MVCVLKGSVVFLADLVRAMDIDVNVDFMSISSYSESRSSSGVVRIVKDLETDLTGRDVLIVEDIVDTGLTLHYLRRTLSARDPASLRTVTLLDKAVRRIIPVELEWSGFEIPDTFVLGYGLDHEGLYRNVSDLIVVPDIAHLVAEPRMYVAPLWPNAAPT
jgi:hypoxanthine phosphoribosyltransferase